MSTSRFASLGKYSIFSVNALIALLIGTLLIGAAHWAIEEKEHRVLHTALHEIGFALIVAVLIWCTFEIFTHAKNEEAWDRRVETISKNVFLGVLRRNFPQALIAEAQTQILDNNFIRENLNITYTLVDDVYKDRSGKDKIFVRLHSLSRFKVRNVGDRSAILPIAISLPNPLIDEKKPFCKVNSISLTTKVGESKPDLAEAEKKFREDIQDNSRHQVNFSIPGISLGPNDEAMVVFSYTTVKEENDTEMLQTIYPADSLIITIIDRGPTARAVRARAIHVADLDDDSSAQASGTYIFKLNRFLLPHQGFVVWWKKTPEPPPIEAT